MIEDTVGYYRKNLLVFPYDENSGSIVDKPMNVNEIVWTVNSDGSITSSGTTSADESNIVLWNRNTSPLKLKAGKYILSGCPEGGSADTYSLVIIKTNGDTYEIVANDFGDGAEFELTEDTNVGVLCKVWSSGVTLNDTFYPMIRYASIEDDTYEPYVEDVQTQIDNLSCHEMFSGDMCSVTIPNGLYYCLGATNGPDGQPGYLQVLSHPASSTLYRKLIFTNYFSNNLFVRTMNDGTWTKWSKYTGTDV